MNSWCAACPRALTFDYSFTFFAFMALAPDKYFLAKNSESASGGRKSAKPFICWVSTASSWMMVASKRAQASGF